MGDRGPVRWHIVYNLLALRLISFGMDLHWARRDAAAGGAPLPPKFAASDSLKVRRLPSHLLCPKSCFCHLGSRRQVATGVKPAAADPVCGFTAPWHSAEGTRADEFERCGL